MSQQKGMSFKEFRQQFQTEETCEAYLFQRRWPEGFVCPKCGGTDCYHTTPPYIGLNKRDNHIDNYQTPSNTIGQEEYV